jgi:hypothetical protein
VKRKSELVCAGSESSKPDTVTKLTQRPQQSSPQLSIHSNNNKHMAFSIQMPWSEGEHRMHELLNVPEHENPTSSFLTPHAAHMSAAFPLTAVGVLDEQQRPWTTVWGGDAGFTRPLGGNVLGTRTTVDAGNDPVVQALVRRKFGKDGAGGERGMMVSALPIDLQNRRRVKLFGRVVAGAVAKHADEDGHGHGHVERGIGEIQLVSDIEQSLGMCDASSHSSYICPKLTWQEIVPSTSIRRRFTRPS